MDQQYSNELTPEIVAELEMSPFTAEEIAAMDQDSRAIIAEGKALEWKHPVNAIWRIATEGNITRCGGIVAPVDSLLDNGDEIISTPQRHTYLVTREGITSGADFLTVTGA
ncbi:hypothetical protein [Enterobacter bugandensis]|uniref:hypothetical protein n=1 Tax=Enterobacter bugandensis TaxID=881260 RepID=UPI0012382656|nr:hypothetical protein [Enterobacter bugandensis]